MFGLFDQLGDVYLPGGDGDYTVLARAGLVCRLVRVTLMEAPGAGVDRVELASKRSLLWLPGYVMPEVAQVVVAGGRWNIKAGSVDHPRGPDGMVAYGRAEVVEAV